MATNQLGGQLYSISRDRCLITTDLNNPNNMMKEKEFPHELTCMLQHKDHKRLFIGDAGGSIYIFHYEDGTLQAAHQIKPNMKVSITTIQFHEKKQFLIIGSKEGIVMVFDLGRPGKVYTPHYNMIGENVFAGDTTANRARSKESLVLAHHQGTLRQL